MDFNPKFTGSNISPEGITISSIPLSTTYVPLNQESLSTSAQKYNITSPVEGAALKENPNIMYGITTGTQGGKKNESPAINYTGKNIELPPNLKDKKTPFTVKGTANQKDIISNEQPELYSNVSDLYKETLSKYKIKDAEIPFGEFISILYGSLDQKSEKTQYKTALEIGIAKYLKEHTAANRHNTDILRIFEGNDPEIETYKQETKAYMEVLEKLGIVTEIKAKEAFMPLIRTENFEVDTWAKAITPEAMKYIGDAIKKTDFDKIKNPLKANIEVLTYMDDVQFKPPLETKIDIDTLKKTYPIITGTGDIPQLAPPAAHP